MIVPFISREDIVAALSSLVYSPRKPVADGLQHLLLVDLMLSTPDMPESDEKRVFAVHKLLVEEITQALNDQCHIFGLFPPREHTRSADIHAEIAELVKVGKHYMSVWLVLYYRYVRADLDLSVEELAQLLAVNTRTIARYVDDGMTMLTQRLLEREQSARRAQIERHLYSKLPYSVPITLVGRQELLKKTHSLLASLSPSHLLITGAIGVGKTAFVQELLRHKIAEGELDQLVWLDEPASTQIVYQQLTEQLLREGGEIKLRDYLLLYHVVVVMDGLDLLIVDRESFSRLLRELGAAVVILINRSYVSIEGIEAHVSLPDLDPASANSLIVNALHRYASVELDDKPGIAQDLYQYFGGNPLTLRLAAGLWENSKNWDTLDFAIHQQLLSQMFTVFNEQVKAAWCGFALIPRPVYAEQLTVLWNIPDRVVNLLQTHGLIEGASDTGYSLIGAAREYIRRAYSTDKNTQLCIARLLADLHPSDLTQDILEQVLITGFPELSLEQRTQYINQFWGNGLAHGHWAKWRVIFEDYIRIAEIVDPAIKIAYGMCLRRLADWEGAQQVFYNVSLECGRSGQFAEQAHAFIEWGILSKYRGDYERAQALIAQTKHYAQRTQDENLLHEAIYQEASILTEQGNGAGAQQLLAALPDSSRGLLIQSEAQLVLGNQSICRTLAERALRLTQGDEATEASLYTIIGRSYQEQSEFEQAHVYLTDTVTLLERLEDIFRLARAQTNLAAVLIAMRRYDDAGMLLGEAIRIQSRLGDRIGLSAARHNQTILASHIAR